MNYIDIIVLVVIAVLSIKGLQNGLIHELISIVGIILGIYLAASFYTSLGEFFGDNLNITNNAVMEVIGFILILSIVWIVSVAIGSILSKFFSFGAFTILNYFGGFIFAFLKYAVILSVIVYTLAQLSFLKTYVNSTISKTYSYPYLYGLGHRVLSFESVQEIYKKLEEKSVDTIKNKSEQIKKSLKDTKTKTEGILENKSNLNEDVKNLTNTVREGINPMLDSTSDGISNTKSMINDGIDSGIKKLNEAKR